MVRGTSWIRTCFLYEWEGVDTGHRPDSGPSALPTALPASEPWLVALIWMSLWFRTLGCTWLSVC